MRVESHQYASDVLEARFQLEWDELRDALGSLDVPLRPAGAVHAGRSSQDPEASDAHVRGRRSNVLLPIDQSAMNERIDEALVHLGWTRQPWILVDRDGQPIDTRLRGDFEKNGVFIEVRVRERREPLP